MNLVLASTSKYRAGLLAQLMLPFIQVDPATLEQRQPGEDPNALCRRLATEKARSAAGEVAGEFLVIGSDQVAVCEDEVLGKPGSFERAFEQLSRCAGRWVNFETGVCLLSSTGYEETASESFAIKFRSLDDHDITRYLNIDTPFDCAGSIKLESVGIALIEDTLGRDLNTALGLPLMLLREMFARAGVNLLNEIN